LNEAVASQVFTIVEAVLKVRTKGCSTLKVTTEQFFRALSIGDIPTISALIRKGNVNVNRTYHGSSALNEAIIHRDGNVVRALLQHGANPDGPEELITYKDQPLFNAIKDRCWDVVDLLLEYGATLAGHHGDANSLLKQLEESSASSCHDVEPGFRDSKVIVHGIYKRLRAAKERHHADAFLSSATKDYKGHALPFVA
jgi:ankyrin repeat protein